MQSNAQLSTKRLYATSALVASFLVLSGPAHASGVPSAPIVPVVTGKFVSGSGTITQSPNETTITVNTSRSITDFNEYNIGANQEVHYQSTVGQANNLSRVTGGDESQILGKLTSNGVNVYLVNPNGVLFGKNAVVDVPNLVVSTSDISDRNFEVGNLNFNIKGKANAKITNNGTITVGDTGLAALVAPTVENNGLIVAKHGKVALAAGEQFTVDMYGDNLVNFAVSDSTNQHLVKQSGKIIAEGGTVLLTAQDANKVVNNVVNLDGVVEASTVKIKGDQIVLGDGADIQASNQNNGGAIAISGNKSISISAKAKINADAVADGNGGTITITAPSLALNGSFSARGYGKGTGGSIETSGDQVSFGDNLTVNTLNAHGVAGQWLIDPSDFTIDNLPGSNANHMNAVDLATLLGTTDVTISASAIGNGGSGLGDINVNSDVIKTGYVDTTLTLNAIHDVNIASGVQLGSVGGALGLNLNAQNNVNVNGVIFTNGGNFNIAGQSGNGDATAFNLATGSSLSTGSGLVKIDATTSNLDAFIGTNRANISGDSATVNVLSNKGNIDQAVNIVKTGGTINLGAGTYSQYVDINKDLTLNGAADNTTIIEKPSNAAAYVYDGYVNGTFKDFYDGVINKAIVLVENANANINGIVVDGTNVGKFGGIPAGQRLVGIGYNNAGGNVTSTTVQNVDTGIVAQSDSSANVFSIYDQTAHNLAVTNSTIQNFATNGLLLDGALLTAGMSGDSINGSSTSQLGVKIGYGTNGTIGTTAINGGVDGLIVDGLDSQIAFNAGDSFSGQSDQYITLTNYAMGGREVSVSGMTFDGVVANNNTTDAQSFVIEDKIHHAMDESYVGLVTWKDNNLYATTNNLGIQRAIDLSNIDGSVNIAAGTYNENLNIGQGISLIGRGVGNTIINGGTNTAIYVQAGDAAVNLSDLTVTTNGADYAVVVDGSVTQTLQSSVVTGGVIGPTGIILGGTITLNGPLVVISGPTNGELNFSMNNVLYSGTQNTAALQFQNATTVGGSAANGVQFRSTAPNGWRFLNVSGDAPKNSYGNGDMDFGNTDFQNSYGQDIRLTNSTMDGSAVDVNFEGDNNNAVDRENLVYHVFDNSADGEIFFSNIVTPIAPITPVTPVNPVTPTIVQQIVNLGSFAQELDRRINDVYYNSVSAAGRIYDTPSLSSARVKTFNPSNDAKVSISAAAPSVINLPTASAAQVAGLSPASGKTQEAETKEAGVHELQIAAGNAPTYTGKAIGTVQVAGNASASDLNNLQTASGGSAKSTAASLNDLQTNSGGLPRQLAANCSVSFGNNFLADSVGTVTGACQ